MCTTVPDPEEAPVPADELARLEEMHRRMKEQQEAWRKLLENMDHLKKKANNDPAPEKPTP